MRIARPLKFFLLFTFFFLQILHKSAQAQMRPLGDASTRDSLSLEQYLDLVLAANPTAISAELEADVAEATLRNAYGEFDPIFEGKIERKTKSGLPTVDFLSAGLELPIGSLFGPKFVAKYKRGTGSRLSSVDLTGAEGEAEIGVKVPLLQGIFLDKRRATFEKAALRPDLSRANEIQIKNNLLLTASELYWDWAEAYSQLRVAQQVYEIAVVRAQALAERVKRGETAALDSVEAMQEVAKRLGDVLKAQRKYEASSIKASVLLWNQDGTPRALNAVPYSLPPAPTLTPAQIEFDRMQALRNRPEVLQIDVEQRAADVDVRFSYEFLRPNLEAQFQALQYFGGASGFDYRIGLSISQPLFFREANAQLQLSQIKATRASLKRLEVERKIQADIDDALSAIGRALERIEAAERETRYAYLVQEGERIRFLAGESSLLILNLRERATASAMQSLVNAQADYLRAISDYLWATGKIQQRWIR